VLTGRRIEHEACSFKAAPTIVPHVLARDVPSSEVDNASMAGVVEPAMLQNIPDIIETEVPLGEASIGMLRNRRQLDHRHHALSPAVGRVMKAWTSCPERRMHHSDRHMLAGAPDTRRQ
jgi:hypothetical protein